MNYAKRLITCCVSLVCLSCQLAMTDLGPQGFFGSDQGSLPIDFKVTEGDEGVSGGEDVSSIDDFGVMGGDADYDLPPRLEDMEVCVPRNEQCNGLDDDCDGQIDESFTDLRELCFSGLGNCQAPGTLVCAFSETSVICDAIEGTPQEEVCDRNDNDCDGLVDEGLVGCCTQNDTQVCGLNQGICMSGQQLCIEERWSECDATGPEAEICDMADNDCDGRVDEGLLNACGMCGEVSLESCDDLDNDCDGRVDEGVTNACGDCGVTPSESCDELDNDCDGRIDEGQTNICGICGVAPSEICDGMDNDCDGRSDEGTTNACGLCGMLPTELCNQIDDDCDGIVDENLSDGPCQLGVGSCRSAGQRRCIQGSYQCDAVPSVGVTEICNTVDDDCDGQSDENNVCSELCNGQDDDADGQIDEGVLNACNQCGSVSNEVCNGIDEDCDGLTDEGVTNVCGVCGPVPTEVCDGNDNDCDGQTDEGVTNICGSCGSVPTEVCDGNDNDCDGQIDENVLNSCGQCGLTPQELCNQLDDDCDGQTDEAFPLLGSSCTNGLGECAVNGTVVCAGHETSCLSGAPNEASNETCNGLDDDCDGHTDETFDLNSDTLNCGSCGSYCVVIGDQCVDGACYCGSQGVVCRQGLICQNGRCSSFNFP